jgi:hypothetical protein
MQPHRQNIDSNFAHNCRDLVYILYRFNSEKNIPWNDYKWTPDQLANTIQAFFTDGSCEVHCKNNGGTKRQPTLPATAPHPVVPRVKGGNANERGQHSTQGRQGRQLLPRSYTPRPGSATTPAKLNQLQADGPCTHETIVHSCKDMMVCWLVG